MRAEESSKAKANAPADVDASVSPARISEFAADMQRLCDAEDRQHGKAVVA